jgi:hypothetical protein
MECVFWKENDKKRGGSRMKKALLYLSIVSLVFLCSVEQLPAENVPTLSNTLQVSVVTYDELLVAIRQTKAESRLRVEQAVEQEKVREAWEIGKLIDTHVLQHKERADYGKSVVIRLAQDLEMSETELKYMMQFARTYPIRPPADELSWTHYRELLSLNEDRERQEVATQAVRSHWTRYQLREEVRRRQAQKKSAGETISISELAAQPGKLYTYRIVKAVDGPYKGRLVVDSGFSTYIQPSSQLPFEEWDIVRLMNGKLKKIPDEKEEALYTYSAYVREVLDGDTFRTLVDLGFGVTTVQTLRLKGIDAREIESREGMEAKEFLEKKLRGASPILIRAVKSDKYDRYLADVFVNGEYVNQELVEEGLAVAIQD